MLAKILFPFPDREWKDCLQDLQKQSKDEMKDWLQKFYCRDNFEFTFDKLRDFDETSCLWSFSADHEFGRIGDPFDIIGRIVGRFDEMFNDLRGVRGLH